MAGVRGAIGHRSQASEIHPHGVHGQRLARAALVTGCEQFGSGPSGEWGRVGSGTGSGGGGRSLRDSLRDPSGTPVGLQ